jgi:hypothetical protein
MKNLITLFIVMFAIQLSIAQTSNRTVSVELGVDPTTISSNDVDWVGKVGMNIGQYGGIAVFYERYDSQNYVSYGIQPSIGTTLIGKLQGSVGTELSVIQLNYKETERYITYAFNMELGYQLNSNVIAFGGLDYKYRPDGNPKEWSMAPGIGIRVYIL